LAAETNQEKFGDGGGLGLSAVYTRLMKTSQMRKKLVS